MKNLLYTLLLISVALACKTEENPDSDENRDIFFDEAVMRKADSLAHAIIITDGHIDLPYRLKNDGISLINKDNGKVVIDAGEGDFDFERARKGGLDAPFMSIYIPARYQETGGAKALADSLIDLVVSITTTYPEKFALANTPQDVQQNFQAGKISLPLGMENGAPIESNLENVKYFYDRGIRYITLTHGKDNEISDSSYDSVGTHNGLSEFGRSVVEEMNRVGIMVDVSHISDSAFYDVMEITKVPVIASHSSCRHFTPGFERNMSDEMIKALAENGGVIQINFGSSFLDSTFNDNRSERRDSLRSILDEKGLTFEDSATGPIIEDFNMKNPMKYANVHTVVDHIDHVVKLAGIDHVGLGSDYDGVGDSLPDGLKDASAFPTLIAALLDRGYSEEDISKICYKNAFRVWNEVLNAAQSE